jgi:hypothetical protein
MKNLQNFYVQELNAQEQKEINGGFVFCFISSATFLILWLFLGEFALVLIKRNIGKPHNAL